MFAFEHAGIRPDCMALGKALGGGVFPVSAFVADRSVMEVFGPGDHGSTFGGNPLAAAVARASLDVIVEEGLAQRAADLGGPLLERLKAIDSPNVREVRGCGLLIGIEMIPSSGPARGICERLADRGILCKETRQKVIRLAPPLTIEEADLDWAAGIIEEVLS